MTLPSLIESGIAELRKRYSVFPVEGDHSQFTDGMFISDVETFDEFLKSFATNVHNAAIESALEALPEKTEHYRDEPNADFHCLNGRNSYRKEARAKVSALKKENV